VRRWRHRGRAPKLPTQTSYLVSVASLIAGCIAQGNFFNLTSGILAVAVPSHRAGTTARAAWVVAFATCGRASLGGVLATGLLSRAPWLRRAG
jgi:hypothetical protein